MHRSLHRRGHNSCMRPLCTQGRPAYTTLAPMDPTAPALACETLTDWGTVRDSLALQCLDLTARHDLRLCAWRTAPTALLPFDHRQFQPDPEPDTPQH